ncbi:MAG: phosphomannomutase/phosphoglucomutase [Candidatus Andersenbacteria bacterium CG10_big_fil_rev_8_21_14_0_10_54_11]|uniref:Phosphomannomutase/phosphoglucomutase n=1 Tax=Candidatus Andersenbacteria bacterium CG10_big_fil_rev_8_21_14_0_10_54_11 TaxID=1974485 RepID=A0A2M6X0D8_9BACT|nr:MAG: phosphomannomutase/phosphoglucomutase [Candidatus Andersenbacteria bacterium CG10_big_fil_rev_8_21_14_0_10_54_11]
MFNPDIYRSYDIRGIVPDEFDPDEAYHIGRAFTAYTGAKRVVIARDMRGSGDRIEPELVRGVTEGGADVVRLGLVTTPLFYFAVHTLHADGGLMVTASHNPAVYNGIKMTRAQAIPIGLESGLADIRDAVQQRSWRDGHSMGSSEDVSVTKAYVDMVTAGASAAGLTVAVDAGNGMTGMLLPAVFERLGGRAVPLYWTLDGSFPNHEADPLKEENMSDLQSAVKSHRADLGVAFDADGDRVFFVTEEGVTIPGDITTALLAREVLREHPESPVIYDIRASRATAEVIAEAGGKPVVSKVGHSNIKPMMREIGAHFAGEVSGHFFFAPWYAESGFLALNYFLRMLQREKKKMSEITAPLLRYTKTPEINFTVADKAAALAKIKAQYRDAKVNELDGIRIDYPDWWASVRASNTEPKLRLNMEADTAELLKEKQTEIEKIITGV